MPLIIISSMKTKPGIEATMTLSLYSNACIKLACNVALPQLVSGFKMD